MTVALPIPPMPENAFHHHVSMPGPVNMPLPRFHPIAVNPNQPLPPDSVMHNHHYRPYPMQEPGPPGPVPATPVTLDHIEARLKQLEQEDAARMAARSHLLAMRKREDEDFRRVTESAEAEEEDLRRQRKRLKRESMGLGFNDTATDSPPLRPTHPRRLSETNAATTLAFFKQQSPHDARPPPGIPAHVPAPTPTPVPLPPQAHQLPPQTIPQDPPAVGSIRRKQKYTIKNIEAWGERHGRPASRDPSGRPLWKRPSDGSLVYLTCPVPGCGKADFVTLHGFMCHLTKKHKDRSLGSQSRALEICGVVFDPSAPLPPISGVKRASTEESRLEQTDPEGYQQELDYESGSEEDPGYAVKSETNDPAEERVAGNVNSSAKQSISSIIHKPDESKEAPEPLSNERSVPERRPDPQSEKENNEPKKAENR